MTHASRCFSKLLVALVLLLKAESVPAQGKNGEISVRPSKAVQLFELEPFQMVCAAHKPIEKCFIQLTRRPVKPIKLYPGLKSESYEYAGRGLDAGDCGIVYHRTSLDMEGNVSCTLVFPDGAANVTEHLQLTVFKLARDIQLQANNAEFTFVQGQSMHFNCTALEGDPLHKETLVMEFDGFRRDIGPGFVKFSKTAEIDDQHKPISCRTQQEGLSTQKSLTIYFDPRAHDQEMNGGVLQSSSNLEVGKRGSVSVRIEANPKPNVTWTLGGQMIDVDGISYMNSIVQEWELTTWKIELHIKKATKEDVEETLLLHVNNIHKIVTFHVKTGNGDKGAILLLLILIGILLVLLLCIISKRVIENLKSERALVCSKRVEKSSKSSQCNPLPLLNNEDLSSNENGPLRSTEADNLDRLDSPQSIFAEKYKSENQEIWKKLKLYEAKLSKNKENQGTLKYRVSLLQPDEDMLLNARLVRSSKPALTIPKNSLLVNSYLQKESDLNNWSPECVVKELLVNPVFDTERMSLVSRKKDNIFGHELSASMPFHDDLFKETEISYVLDFKHLSDAAELDFSQTTF